MTTYQRPGVFIEERLNPLAPSVGSTSSTVAAFIGALSRGPEDVTLVTSWNDYASKYGTWNTLPATPGGDNKLAIAVKLFFDNGGPACYVKRVTAGSPTAATRTLTDGAVSPATPANIATISAVNAGDWGESIFVSVSSSAVTGRKDVQISYPDAATVVENFTDLTFTDEADARYAINFINTRSKYVTVTSVAKTAQPANTTSPAALASGSDGTVPTATNIAAGVSAFDTVFNSLLLNAPGLTVQANVTSLLTYAAARQDVFVVIDPVAGDVDTQLTLADTYPESSFGAIYYPNVTIADPTVNTRGATRTASPAGAVMGLYATTDASRGVFKAPAGTSSRLANVVAVQALTNAELDLMNSATSPVNPIKYVAGSGFVVMGARTLKPGYVDRYIPVRRSLIYLRKALTDLTQYAVFEPNDAVLWRSLNATVAAFLTDFWAQGGLRGDVPEDAFFVKCDEELNTLAVIDEGKVLLEIGVALQRPAEFVIIKIGQFDGGATVTVTA
jgi:uncharacterized protein